MRDSASIVIVGGGIVGCSAAYHLARLGWRDIVVLEQGPLFQAGGSTSHAPGIVFQTNASKTMTDFAQETVRALLRRSSSTASRACTRSAAWRWRPRRERWDDLNRKLGWRASWGLDGGAALAGGGEGHGCRCSTRSTILGAYCVPSDGVAKAVRAVRGDGPRRRGATAPSFHGDTPVTGIEVGGRARPGGGHAAAGAIATERVLICAGIWGPQGRATGRRVDPADAGRAPVRLDDAAAGAGRRDARGRPPDPAPPGPRHVLPPARATATASAPTSTSRCWSTPEAIRRPRRRRRHAGLAMPFTPEHFAQAWADAVELLPALADAADRRGDQRHVLVHAGRLPAAGRVGRGARLLGGRGGLDHARRRASAEAVAEWMTDGAPSSTCASATSTASSRTRRRPAYVRARGAQQYREVYDIIHPLQPMERAAAAADEPVLRAAAGARRRLLRGPRLGAAAVVRRQRAAARRTYPCRAARRLGGAVLVADRRRRAPGDARAGGAVRHDAADRSWR